MEKNQYPSYNLYYGAYLGWITCLIINMVSVPDIVFLYLAFLWAIFVALTPQPVILKTGPSFDHHLILGTSV
jgi:hypothetical protein